MSSSEHIVGSEKLVAALGYWPSFHDAEIVSISAQRGLPVAPGVASVELVVRAGSREERPCQILVCRHVTDLELSEFNHQNVINSLSVQVEPSAEAQGSPLVLTLESIWGLGGTVRCATVELSSVQELSSGSA